MYNMTTSLNGLPQFYQGMVYMADDDVENDNNSSLLFITGACYTVVFLSCMSIRQIPAGRPDMRVFIWLSQMRTERRPVMLCG